MWNRSGVQVRLSLALGLLLIFASAPSLRADEEPWRVVRTPDGALYLLEAGVRHSLTPELVPAAQLTGFTEGEAYVGVLPLASRQVNTEAYVPVLVESGYYQPDGADWVKFQFVVHNPSPTHALEQSTFGSTVYAPGDVVLTTTQGQLPRIREQSNFGHSLTLFIPSGFNVERVDMTFGPGRMVPVGTPQSPGGLPPALVAEGVQFGGNQPAHPQAIGVIRSQTGSNMDCVEASAILYSADGRIVGGGFARVGSIPARGSRAFAIRVDTPEVPSRIEVYPREGPAGGCVAATNGLTSGVLAGNFTGTTALYP